MTNNQPAHRIEMGRPLRHVVDSHGPGAEVEVTIDGRVARVRTRRHGKPFTADQMIAAALRQLGERLDQPENHGIPTYWSGALGRRVTVPE